MKQVLDSPWGRLFENWERLTPTADGFPDVGDARRAAPRTADCARSDSRWAFLAPASRKRPSSRAAAADGTKAA